MMKGKLGLHAYDKDTGKIIPGAQIVVQDGKITVTAHMGSVLHRISVLPDDSVTVTYCYRIVDTDPDSPTFGKTGHEYVGIKSVEGGQPT